MATGWYIKAGEVITELEDIIEIGAVGNGKTIMDGLAAQGDTIQTSGQFGTDNGSLEYRALDYELHAGASAYGFLDIKFHYNAEDPGTGWIYNIPQDLGWRAIAVGGIPNLPTRLNNSVITKSCSGSALHLYFTNKPETDGACSIATEDFKDDFNGNGSTITSYNIRSAGWVNNNTPLNVTNSSITAGQTGGVYSASFNIPTTSTASQTTHSDTYRVEVEAVNIAGASILTKRLDIAVSINLQQGPVPVLTTSVHNASETHYRNFGGSASSDSLSFSNLASYTTGEDVNSFTKTSDSVGNPFTSYIYDNGSPTVSAAGTATWNYSVSASSPVGNGTVEQRVINYRCSNKYGYSAIGTVNLTATVSVIDYRPVVTNPNPTISQSRNTNYLYAGGNEGAFVSDMLASFAAYVSTDPSYPPTSCTITSEGWEGTHTGISLTDRVPNGNLPLVIGSGGNVYLDFILDSNVGLGSYTGIYFIEGYVTNTQNNSDPIRMEYSVTFNVVTGPLPVVTKPANKTFTSETVIKGNTKVQSITGNWSATNTPVQWAGDSTSVSPNSTAITSVNDARTTANTLMTHTLSATASKSPHTETRSSRMKARNIYGWSVSNPDWFVTSNFNVIDVPYVIGTSVATKSCSGSTYYLVTGYPETTAACSISSHSFVSVFNDNGTSITDYDIVGEGWKVGADPILVKNSTSINSSGICSASFKLSLTTPATKSLHTGTYFIQVRATNAAGQSSGYRTLEINVSIDVAQGPVPVITTSWVNRTVSYNHYWGANEAETTAQDLQWYSSSATARTYELVSTGYDIQNSDYIYDYNGQPPTVSTAGIASYTAEFSGSMPLGTNLEYRKVNYRVGNKYGWSATNPVIVFKLTVTSLETRPIITDSNPTVSVSHNSYLLYAGGCEGGTKEYIGNGKDYVTTAPGYPITGYTLIGEGWLNGKDALIDISTEIARINLDNGTILLDFSLSSIATSQRSATYYVDFQVNSSSGASGTIRFACTITFTVGTGPVPSVTKPVDYSFALQDAIKGTTPRQIKSGTFSASSSSAILEWGISGASLNTNPSEITSNYSGAGTATITQWFDLVSTANVGVYSEQRYVRAKARNKYGWSPTDGNDNWRVTSNFNVTGAPPTAVGDGLITHNPSYQQGFSGGDVWLYSNFTLANYFTENGSPITGYTRSSFDFDGPKSNYITNGRSPYNYSTSGTQQISHLCQTGTVITNSAEWVKITIVAHSAAGNSAPIILRSRVSLTITGLE